MDKTALLVDGSNLHAMRGAMGYDLDFNKLRTFFPNTVTAKYFTALTDKSVENNLRKLVDWLDFHGWNVIQKPVKEFMDNGIQKLKGNMDIEICIHALKAAKYCAHIALVSGDGDFRVLVETLQDSGCMVSVLSTRDLVADELRRQCNVYYDLFSMEQELSKHSAPKPAGSRFAQFRRSA